MLFFDCIMKSIIMHIMKREHIMLWFALVCFDSIWCGLSCFDLLWCALVWFDSLWYLKFFWAFETQRITINDKTISIHLSYNWSINIVTAAWLLNLINRVMGNVFLFLFSSAKTENEHISNSQCYTSDYGTWQWNLNSLTVLSM